MTEETSLWKGSPSQWLNIGPFAGALILAGLIAVAGVFTAGLALFALVIPAVWMLWQYLTVRCQTFELTTERLKVSKGVINQHIDEVSFTG